MLRTGCNSWCGVQDSYFFCYELYTKLYESGLWPPRSSYSVGALLPPPFSGLFVSAYCHRPTDPGHSMSSWFVRHMEPKMASVAAWRQGLGSSCATGWTNYVPNSRNPDDVGECVAAAVATVSSHKYQLTAYSSIQLFIMSAHKGGWSLVIYYALSIDCAVPCMDRSLAQSLVDWSCCTLCGSKC